MPNNRIHYGIIQAGIAPDASSTYTAIHGLQQAGITTNFEITYVKEMGQLQVYDAVEELPDVEVSATKILDGYLPIYCLATQQATAPTLAARAVPKCSWAMSIFDESASSASGNPLSEVICSGMFVNSVTYTFPVDENFTEEVTLGGNNKVWMNDSKYSAAPTNFSFAGAFSTNSDTPQAVAGTARREQFLYLPTAVFTADSNGASRDPDATVLPAEVHGISTSGVNNLTSGIYGARVQRVSVSTDFNRENLNELGHRGPYARTVNFPVDVTTEVEVISYSGDMISATENGIYTTGTGCVRQNNLRDRTIRIAVCEGLRIYTGKKNKLTSSNMSGSDAEGGNLTTSYSFTTQNTFTVMHSGEQALGATPSGWWAARATHLGPA